MKTSTKTIRFLALALAVASLLVMTSVASAQGGPDGNRRGGGLPTGTLTPAEIDAMNQVLQDEYHAWAVYDQVIADFGDISPFVQIQQAEAQHAAAVERVFVRYNLTLPANDWTDADIASFADIEAACAAGVAAETANADLYTWALSTTDKRDLINVFTNLQAASLESHLPAFETCDTTAAPAPENGGGFNGGQGGRWGNTPPNASAPTQGAGTVPPGDAIRQNRRW